MGHESMPSVDDEVKAEESMSPAMKKSSIMRERGFEDIVKAAEASRIKRENISRVNLKYMSVHDDDYFRKPEDKEYPHYQGVEGEIDGVHVGVYTMDGKTFQGYMVNKDGGLSDKMTEEEAKAMFERFKPFAEASSKHLAEQSGVEKTMRDEQGAIDKRIANEESAKRKGVLFEKLNQL